MCLCRFIPVRDSHPLRYIRLSPFIFKFGLKGLSESFGCHYRWKLGIILNGDWDKALKDIEKMPIFVALDQVFCQGFSWCETQFYQNSFKQIKKGVTIKNCKNEQDLQNRTKAIETLYGAIRVEGYKTQRDLGLPYASSDIIACIDRYGRFIFFDGRHRLAITRLLNITTISVIICARHTVWQNFAKKLRWYVKKNGGVTRYPVPHPDFQDIPHKYDEKLFCNILKRTRDYKGKVLNINVGLSFGYLSHRFEDNGFNCIEVNLASDDFLFITKLKKASEKKFVILNNFSEYLNKHKIEVVLAIDVLHHFLKSKQDFLNLITQISRLNTDAFIFNLPLQKNCAEKFCYKHLDAVDITSMIQNSIQLNQLDLIKSNINIGDLYFLH